MSMSGWPSGLRRQTQGNLPSLKVWAFWSSSEGVGSNPTSDNPFFEMDYATRGELLIIDSYLTLENKKKTRHDCDSRSLISRMLKYL